ncbi:TPA: excinuclease ABC subunit B [Patescibacteria group bacterium]|nr:MAG: UvrABC system protein B [Parcubacteria group bacterium GW2011_GWA2_46_39]HBV33595.1 excinuclease ABC subunit B [Patescibacteria group bacterium]
MSNNKFILKSPFSPTGDQPQAIQNLVKGLNKGLTHQTLLGVTGSGKTFTMASVIAQLQRPTLVISHNKTLAAQLASEFRQFFPTNAVHYFVSYYDYYQPEAYIPQSDTYIEKETKINDEIDRLRHASTQAILSRRDTLIVASVSCIYGLGSPQEYSSVRIQLKVGQKLSRQKLLRQLTDLQYPRADLDFRRGTFRVTGEVVEIYPAFALDQFYRLTYDGDVIESIEERAALTLNKITAHKSVDIYPATHYLAPTARFQQAIKEIKHDAQQQVKKFQATNKLIEAQRLQERTNFDLEMIATTGYCNGIENYSRYFDGRKPGTPPFTLIDYFPKDWLLFIDESHMTVPQIRGMYSGDRSRKQTLIDYGFRLPAAYDNRPLKFDEFTARLNQTIYVSATPADYELNLSQNVAEQVVRPTGLLDPNVEVRPSKGQIEHLLQAIKVRTKNKQRVLVTTLTKRMAEELADYLRDEGVKVHYLHSEIDTFERLEILHDLRAGKYDVIVGINLLREGLDLPEVSLVAILDADKEGFLRSTQALIQTMGRAARHSDGHVIMYADKITSSMKLALSETKRRRQKQQAYNQAHNLKPQTIIKKLQADRLAGGKLATDVVPVGKELKINKLPKEEIKFILRDLTNQMNLAAENLEFEKAANLRDRIKEIEVLAKPVHRSSRRRQIGNLKCKN